MNGLVFLFVLFISAFFIYLLYNAGVINDIITWAKNKLSNFKLPEKPLYDRNIITKPKKTETKTFKTVIKENLERNGHRSKVGQKLSDWEIGYLWDGISKRKRVPCFNCLNEDMYSGAQGGMSQNWHCPNCGQGINLTIIKASKDGILCDNIGIDTSYKR